MDEKEKDLQEFSLEDILKEFSTLEESDDPAILEEDVRVWDGKPDPDAAKQPAQDTVRLDEITKAVRQQQETTEETIRLAPVEPAAEPVSDDTVRFAPAGEETNEEPFIIPVPEEQVEPYSKEWEPEYEQPIGEYIPPEPIVFRPKNRLRELKRKLVEGPERRYYELAEKGLGKLQIAIFINFLIMVVAVGAVAMKAFGLVGDNRLRLLVYSQFLCMMLSTLLGSYQLMEGIANLFRGRFTLDTLLVFTCIACWADGILSLKLLRFSCCGVFSVSMTFALWAAYQRRNTEMAQMDTLRKATRLDGIVRTPDCYEGRAALLRCDGQVEDFMDHYKAPSVPEKVMRIYALCALFVCFGVGVAAGVLHSTVMGIQCLAAALLVATPATAFITLSRPAALLERRLHKLGTVLCGWRGVRGLSRNAVFPVTDNDLFPAGSAKLNGVKFYGSRNPDEVVAYAAAVICANGGGLAPLFSQLLESRNGHHYDANQLQGYAGGVGGVVDGEAVLAGTLSFMQSMGVQMPEGTRVNQAVYVAIDGSLSGVFAMTYSKVKAATTGITTLCAYRGLTPVMTGGDFMLTEGFLRSKFGVNTRRIAFPGRRERAELAAAQPEEGEQALAMTTSEGLASLAYAATGARALRSASITGVVVHMMGGILGMLIVLALTLVGADQLLNPVNLLLYQLLWSIPGFLITEWTRAV